MPTRSSRAHLVLFAIGDPSLHLSRDTSHSGIMLLRSALAENEGDPVANEEIKVVGDGYREKEKGYEEPAVVGDDIFQDHCVDHICSEKRSTK